MNTNEIACSTAFCLLVFFSLVPALTSAQTRDQTLQAISKLHGPERETKVREGARKEGNLIWYSSTTADDSLVLSQKFQEVYPFVKVAAPARPQREDGRKNPSGIARGQL